MDGSCGSTDFEVKPELRTPPHPTPFRSRSANFPVNLKNSGVSEETKKSDETLLQPVKKRVPLDYHLLEFFDKQTCSPGLGMQRKGNSGMVTPNRPNSGNSEYANSPNENGEIKWSIEELSALKPVHFTAEDIARSTFSPDPALDAMIQAKLDVYWKTNRPFIPSPEVSSSSSDHNMMNLPNMNFTPSSSGIPLRDFIRSREAFKVGNPILSSSPVQRPRRASLTYKRMRNATVQTACTIPPSFDFDFEKILGQSCVYEPPENETDEEEFNVSLDASIGRRKLFLDDEVQPAEAPGNGTSIAEPENDDEPPIRHIINLDDAEDMLSAVLGAQTESTSTSKMDFEGHLTMEVGMISHESFDYKMLAACPLSPIINKSQSAEDEE